MTESHSDSNNPPLDLGLEIPSGFELLPLFPADRLLRLHPYWFIQEYKEEGADFSAEIQDYLTDAEFSLSGSKSSPQDDSQLLRIELTGAYGTQGEDSVTILFTQQDSILKAQLIQKSGPVEEEDPLLIWVLSIREYIRIYLKKTPVTLFFRVLMNRMILDMNPSQRKISMMIAKITAVELLVIVLIVVGYAFFVL